MAGLGLDGLFWAGPGCPWPDYLQVGGSVVGRWAAMFGTKNINTEMQI